MNWWIIGPIAWISVGTIIPIWFIRQDLDIGLPFKVSDLARAIGYSMLGPILPIICIAAIVSDLCEPISYWFRRNFKKICGL